MTSRRLISPPVFGTAFSFDHLVGAPKQRKREVSDCHRSVCLSLRQTLIVLNRGRSALGECVLRADALPYESAEAEARRLYEKAIKLDPDYGRAHALLAYIVHLEWLRDMSGSDRLLDRAFELAKKAVAHGAPEKNLHAVSHDAGATRHVFASPRMDARKYGGHERNNHA
jgi:tetratricopeptide (TPR) repeat protein